MSKIESFSIKVPQRAIEDLHSRIRHTRWPDEILHSEWNNGTSLAYTKEIADYWMSKFDWRRSEEQINQHPNFLAEINGIKIHFLHIKSLQKEAIPLIITHGWPGSFLEMMKLIPLLQNSAIPFDLIIPSIPGFGFSQKVNTPGCNIWFIADLWNNLIKALGYKKVIAQGGDFGAGIHTALALRYPGILLGLHLNYIHSAYAPFLRPGEEYTMQERQFLESAKDWYDREGAYSHQQRTKPLTLAYGLQDSPVGLCAWILEKFYGWSDCNGNIESIFSKDELLSNISLYWFTETIHSSIRLYYENRKAPVHFTANDFVSVPVGIAHFHKEEPFPPRKFIERGFNIQQWSDISPGGHFAAVEQPHLLANDIITFAEKISTHN
jgi:pimeloyl-ACP methyl ester carboxylesterase